ncbi:MAG: tRNA pseudouridine(55) synthase TruB [Patescibacteria group bacterium]|jgi:tRNA pseudouridine55 synthase
MDPKTGFLLVDKPVNISSHRVVSTLRRVTGLDRIGYSGTLDPFASGLLIVGIGKDATRKLDNFLPLTKAYEALIILGRTSDTLDPDSAIKDTAPCLADDATIEKAMQGLTGHLEQIPPMHSAIKVHGEKLYNLARQGIVIERKPRAVTVTEFTLLEPIKRENGVVELHVRISCSSGTYIRAIARDLGTALGTGGYLEALRRLSVGPFEVSKALNLAELGEKNWEETLLPLEIATIDTPLAS